MNEIFPIALVLCWGLLSLALVLGFCRLIRGPTLADRVVAFDLMVSIMVGMIALFAIYARETVYLDVALVLALISFLGTVIFSKYLMRRGTVHE